MAEDNLKYPQLEKDREGLIMRDFLIWGIAIIVLIVAGCVNSPGPVNKTSNASTSIVPPVRYVELRMVDGSRIGGEYVSENANFVTIIPLYVFEGDSDKLINGSGIEMGIKIALVNTMTNITDPRPLIKVKLQEQREAAEAEAKARENASEASKTEQEKLRAEMMRRGELTP